MGRRIPEKPIVGVAAMFRILTIWLVLIVATALAGCGDSGTRSKPPQTRTNLLANGSFERDGHPSLEGWAIADSSLTSVVSQAAPGGGNYSLELSVGWIPTTAVVTTKVPATGNGDILRLSAYIRAVGPEGGGMISLFVGSTPWSQRPRVTSVSSEDTAWTFVNFVDTFSIGEHDTLWVQLAAFGAEVAPVSAGLFDMVVLERLDD